MKINVKKGLPWNIFIQIPLQIIGYFKSLLFEIISMLKKKEIKIPKFTLP